MGNRDMQTKCDLTIQVLPTKHSHFEFFPAFYKAKNAHWGGESYSYTYMYKKTASYV